MKLLLTESTPGNASELRKRFLVEGHDVVHCADDAGGPCRGAQRHGDCPLESQVDLAILAREPGAPHTLAEMGSVCATRYRVPLTVVDPKQADDELPSVTVAHALASRFVEVAYEVAVRKALSHLPTVVNVCRLVDSVRVTVQLPESQNNSIAISAAADRARAAIRAHDPFVQRIDVSVACHPD